MRPNSKAAHIVSIEGFQTRDPYSGPMVSISECFGLRPPAQGLRPPLLYPAGDSFENRRSCGGGLTLWTLLGPCVYVYI